MVRTVALAIGIGFVAVGLLGLIMEPTQGILLELFAVNTLHNLIHLLTGIAGIAAYFLGWGASRTFNQVLGVAYLALGVLGFIPNLFSEGLFLGLIPLNLVDNFFHLIVGGVAAYFGFAPQYRSRSMGDVVRGR